MKVLKGVTAGVLCLTFLSAPAIGGPLTEGTHQVEASVQTKAMYANTKTDAYTTRSSKSKRVMTIPYGVRIDRLAVHSSWSQVRYNGKIGWVASRNLVEIKKTEVLDTKQTVTMYASRSTKAKTITKIPTNKQVTRLAVNKSWSQVKYGNRTGWVASSQLKPRYTKETFAPRGYQVKEDAPLQSTYTTNGKMLVSIPKETIVSSAERYNGWYKVTFNGKTGWVSGKYLVAYTAPASPPPAPAPTPAPSGDAVSIAKNVFGSGYEIDGSGRDVDVYGNGVSMFVGNGISTIRQGGREDYTKAAKIITALYGGDANTLANYMWDARPGQRYADGVSYGKYTINMHTSGGASVNW